jgi:uncharacterized protein HemX
MADPTSLITPEAGGGGVVGALAMAAAAWLKGKLASGGERSAEKAHEELDQVKERLTRIESTLEAARDDSRRHEDGILALQAKLDTMHQAAATAQIELATTLGRIEGEMRARRERGQVTP